MRFLRRRWFLIAAGMLVLGGGGTWLVAGRSSPVNRSVVASATRGPFTVTVTTSGELKASESVQITVPAKAMQARAYQMRISSLVPEGTVVKAGDVVAELDRSALATQLTEVTLALQKAEAQMQQAMLDSTLNLSAAREAIHTMELDLEAKRLAKDEAVYEAPTIRRQAEIDYERAERALAQARTDYQTKTEQARAKMSEVGAEVARQRNLTQVVQEVLEGFTIRAPAAGMVIYVREWNGRKRTTGSQVSYWDPGVATLPDLTHMESITYVNEIDVRRVAVDQPVAITLDADPDKRLTGKVTSVANVGEQRPNADAKVFEVHIAITESDTTLRPGMTTGNEIETLRIPRALAVPLEALHGESGMAFVYRLNGGDVVRQEVVTGPMNDRDVVIERGLDEHDQVLLSVPPDPEGLPLVRLTPAPGGAPAAAAGDSTGRAPAPAPARDSMPQGG
jgi:multidrug efflux pump subunit AcrA (membrane-fusion protein)